MLGLDILGITLPSRGGGGGGSAAGANANAAADSVASKAQRIISSAPSKAGKIIAHAKKALAKAKDTKAKVAKAAKKPPPRKATLKKPSLPARSTASALSRPVAPTHAPLPARSAPRLASRVMGDDDGTYDPGPLTMQAIDPALIMAAIQEMMGYSNALDGASQILTLIQQLNQLVPQTQAAGLTDLYNQGNALLNEANSYDPNSPTDLATRGAQWVQAAQAALANAPVQPGGMQQTAPADYGGGGGGGDSGGGFGGGGGFPSPADDQGGADDGGAYDPEGDASAEAEQIEDTSLDDGGFTDTYGSFEDNYGGADDSGDDDQVVGLHGLDIFVGADDVAPTRQGTARDFGLLDMAYACVVGAHLSASKPLEDYARQISGQILNQTIPALTARTFSQQLEALAGEIAKVTKRNPLDEVYPGPVFAQSHNDLFSGRLLDAPAHALEEAAPEIAKKMADAAGGLGDFMTTLKWIGIVGAGLAGAILLGVLGVKAHGWAKK